MCQTPDHNAIDPSNLKLELTESMVLDDINGTILKMNAREIGIEATNTVIVQTIIGMTNNLSIEVVAEGVESYFSGTMRLFALPRLPIQQTVTDSRI